MYSHSSLFSQDKSPSKEFTNFTEAELIKKSLKFNISIKLLDVRKSGRRWTKKMGKNTKNMMSDFNIFMQFKQYYLNGINISEA
jgi:hypothetical protein